ncbi:MAG TPA: pyrroline-5-carboxylate reductase [Acidimicrobiia bacterium]|nr:pyrroline-5-carboxylate reductase [Acidimicrobiia bacterium]
MSRPTVAILGAGAIGEALALGLLAGGWAVEDITLAARREDRRAEIERLTGIRCTLDVVEAVQGRQVVVVSVKPSDVGHLLGQLGDAITRDHVVLSLAAGVPTRVFEAALGDARVVRAMPNTPVRIAEAITAIARGSYADDDALALVQTVLAAVGQTIVLDEPVLDAVTAVSGTGPAYVFLLAEALVEAAIREGIPWHAAEQLVEQTLRGAGMLLAATDATPARLRAQVTSPGGTTAAAVHVLEERGFRAIVEDAVRAAAQRSREMGRSAAGEEG